MNPGTNHPRLARAAVMAFVTLGGSLPLARAEKATVENAGIAIEGWLAVTIILISGLLIWWQFRRTRHRIKEQADHRLRKLSDLIEHADCILWESEVELLAGGSKWKMMVHPSAFTRRIFGPQMPNVASGLWDQFQVPDKTLMAQRARDAMQGRQPGYVQEFSATRDGRTYWMHENVSINPMGENHYWLVGLVTDITVQKEAELARKQSELNIERILAHAQCLLWRATVQRVNDEMIWEHFDVPHSQLSELIFGEQLNAPDRRFWDNMTVPELPLMTARSTRAMLNGSPGYAKKFKATTATNQVLWLNEQVMISKLSENSWSLVGVVTDITAQHDAELARAASEARLQELLARADCLLWEGTVVLTEDDWQWDFHVQQSGLCERLFGVSQPHHQVGLWRTFNIPEREEMNQRCRSAMMADQSRYEQVFHIVRPDGSIIWISESVTIRRLSEREFSLVGIAVDITPQRRAEDALAAEKDRLSVTLRSMNEAVATTDTTGRIHFMNPAAARLTGWKESEAVDHAVNEVIQLQFAGEGPAMAEIVRRVAEGGGVFNFPAGTQLIQRDGQARLIDGCCAPIQSSKNKVIGTVLALRDVTDQIRLEQELVRATRLESVGVLAGGIAHDFNNILTAVIGNLTLAELDINPDSPAKRSLHDAEKAAMRARDLTQQLLTFAKGGEPVRAAVHLDEVVREMTSFSLHGSNVKAYFDLAPDLWPADADKGQIGRVVQNLVINAVQAMPQGGTLRIVACNDVLRENVHSGLAAGNYLQIAITDTGEGIKPEILAHIFDPYFTTKDKGSGLGLAAVYSIIKKHQGHVAVDSQLGQGTTFRLWLPATKIPQPTQKPNAPVSAPGKLNGKVLFMDDERIICDLAGALLKRLGLQADCVADGGEAVKKYREQQAKGSPYDLVIMDLTIPGGMGGLATMTELKRIDPQVRAIVSSGYSSDPVLANYESHGFAAVMIKPYDVSEFTRITREALSGRG